MRWRTPGCGVVVCAAALVAASIIAWGAMVVPWQAAGSYDGETITVEGDVVRARLEADTCVLEFSTDDPNAFRAILLIPLITDLPRQPQRLYENKRVQVSGTDPHLARPSGDDRAQPGRDRGRRRVGQRAAAGDHPDDHAGAHVAPAIRRRRRSRHPRPRRHRPPLPAPAPPPSAPPTPVPPPPAPAATVPAPIVPPTTLLRHRRRRHAPRPCRLRHRLRPRRRRRPRRRSRPRACPARSIRA